MSMGLPESARNLNRKPYRLVRWKWPAERFPVHVLQHQVVGSDIIYLANMWMVQCRDSARFLFEPVAVLSRQPLDGDDSVEPCVACLPDFAHPASAKRSDNLVRAKVRTWSEDQ